MNNSELPERKCSGIYPEWKTEKAEIGSEIDVITPRECLKCYWIDACRIRVLLWVNLKIELSHEELLEIQKAIVSGD